MGKSQVEEGEENRERDHLRYFTVTPRRKWDFPCITPLFYHITFPIRAMSPPSKNKNKNKETKKPYRDKEREYFLNTKPLFAVTSLMLGLATKINRT